MKGRIFQKPKLLMLVQLPPPVHGVSQINKQISDAPALNDLFRLQILELKFSNTFIEIRSFTILKVFKAFLLSLKLCASLIWYRPNIVYFSFMPVGFGFFRDAFYLLLIKFSGTKVVLHLHNKGIETVSNRLTKAVYRILLRNCTIIHLSKTLVEGELKPLYLKKSKPFIVPNGIDDSAKGLLPKKDSDEIHLLFLSNLFPEKGVFLLLDMFPSLVETNNSLILHIVGSPTKTFLSQFHIFINNNQTIASRIRYHGELFEKEKHLIFLSADIFIFPSYFQEECMPLSILEAMQFALPVVAFRIGAIDELIKHGENGFLAEKNDLVSFKAFVLNLINNKDIRSKMGQISRNMYLEKFTLDIFNKNMIQVFNSVLHD